VYLTFEDDGGGIDLIELIPFYAGVTASGTGKAQLVFALAAGAYATSTPMPATPRRGQPRVLVVDDSRLSRDAGVACSPPPGTNRWPPKTAGRPGRS